MIEVDKVNAIIGSLHSGNVQAVGDIVEAAKIPCMGTGTSPQWLQKGWTYMFRPTLNTYYSSLSAIRVCEVLEMKKIGIFYSQDEYGKNGKDNMVDLCEEYGIDILATESMKPGDSDFTAQVANLKKVNPDGLYVIATADNLPPMVKQIRAGGIDGYIFGEQSLGMPEVKKVAGAASDKVVFGACFIMPSTDPAEAQIPEIVDFFTKYRDIYGEMCPSEVAVRCYDALYILKAAVEKAQSIEGTTVRDAIWTISDFKGLQGTFDFTDKSGEGLRESRLYITMDGKDILLDDYLASR
jgi:branched-chain amino acid transport system substrate-binding protein